MIAPKNRSARVPDGREGTSMVLRYQNTPLNPVSGRRLVARGGGHVVDHIPQQTFGHGIAVWGGADGCRAGPEPGGGIGRVFAVAFQFILLMSSPGMYSRKDRNLVRSSYILLCVPMFPAGSPLVFGNSRGEIDGYTITLRCSSASCFHDRKPKGSLP